MWEKLNEGDRPASGAPPLWLSDRDRLIKKLVEVSRPGILGAKLKP
ncbi:MAG TPA: hypothetical protein V6D02_02980 [Candidatus Obscuribacterales bacterium]